MGRVSACLPCGPHHSQWQLLVCHICNHLVQPGIATAAAPRHWCCRLEANVHLTQGVLGVCAVCRTCQSAQLSWSRWVRCDDRLPPRHRSVTSVKSNASHVCFVPRWLSNQLGCWACDLHLLPRAPTKSATMPTVLSCTVLVKVAEHSAGDAGCAVCVLGCRSGGGAGRCRFRRRPVAVVRAADHAAHQHDGGCPDQTPLNVGQCMLRPQRCSLRDRAAYDSAVSTSLLNALQITQFDCCQASDVHTV